MSIRLAATSLAMAALLAACATPPNTTIIKFESVPAGAAILSPHGAFLGLTPFEIQLPLTREWIAADFVRLGTGTAIWKSGARIKFNLDYRLDGITSGTLVHKISRPGEVPGLHADVQFAEDRDRRSGQDSTEGFGVLADLIRENNRQKAALPSLPDALSPRPVGGSAIECVSRRTWPNQVQTTCK